VCGIPGPLQSFWKSNDILFRRLRTDGLQTGSYPRQSDHIDTGKSASDDGCCGSCRDKLSGWLILDPISRSLYSAVGELHRSDRDAHVLSAADVSTEKSEQMGSSLV
jgi:hypothetical protein